MSHRSVELVIGRLATDEGFRRRFVADATGALSELRQQGHELTVVEVEALLALDLTAIDRLADAIDQRLQKVDFGSA
jgi:Ribosomally synthesized peptide prototyped by Frankia Franean1_4349.